MDRTDLGGATAQRVGGIGVGTVKAVCRDTCNNGWMKRLEDRTKPILQRIILKDDPVDLSQDDQETLATWAFKTATMLTIKYSKLPSETLRRPLFDHQRPPPTAIVWMARVNPETVRIGSGPLLSTTHNDPPVHSQGFIARLVIGNVGFVVLGNPAPRRGTWFVAKVIRERFIPIWPVEGPFRWPIGQTVTATDLDALALLVRRVLTSDHPLAPSPDHHVFTFDEEERT